MVWRLLQHQLRLPAGRGRCAARPPERLRASRPCVQIVPCLLPLLLGLLRQVGGERTTLVLLDHALRRVESRRVPRVAIRAIVQRAATESALSMSTATPMLAPGTTLGDGYVVERSLGGGGMGQVYLARDLRLDRLVAVKLLHAEVAANQEAEGRFRREARALSRVLHPNVVGIHAFGRHAETWYLVMEYVEGRSLETMLQEGALTVELAVELTRQIAAGLAEAHALGIVHRDIKPGNVLLRTLATGALLAKVADFGLARSMVSDDSNVVTRDTAILGTPAYMAPEQIQAQKVDGRADLYALAIMLYQMLTGQLPYQRETMQAMLIAHLIDEPPPLTPEQTRAIPAAIDRELRRALSKRPEDRHASVTEFAQALDRALGKTTWSGDGEICHCPGCGNHSTSGGFCVHCGSAVPAERCAACGSERAGERYDCEVCGASLLQGPSSSAAVLGALRSSSAALLLARLGDVQGAQLSELAETFITAVAREGGRTLAMIGGDAVAVFGLGGMREGDTARAVDAALAMTARHPASATASLKAVVEVGSLISRGTGITWGMALLAGEVVEKARTACQKAPPGTVVVGDTAWHDCRGLFEVRTDGRQRQVVRRRDALQALGDYMNRDPVRPFVGRSAELVQAQRACRRVRRDQGLVTLAVVGPSEVGKSRVLGELLKRLETTDDRWRFELIRCSPLSVPSGWQPLAGLVRDAVVSTEDETVALRVSRLPGIQEDDHERSARRAQALLRMLGMDEVDPEGQAPRPASDAELAAANEAWVAVVRGLCRQQPMALVIEDLQYAKPMLLQLLAHLARTCGDVPLCLILPLRPDRADPVLQALQLPPSRLVTIELERLEGDEADEFVDVLLGDHGVPAGLAAALHRFGEGLPGRIEQAVDTLIDEGHLQLHDDAWIWNGKADLDQLLARSLGELLLRRVGRLTPGERSLLEAVAVAGGTAPRGMLAALLQREIRPAETDRLVQAGLLLENRTQTYAGHREWSLRPASLAELLVGALPKQPLQELNRRAALWLEGWPGARPPSLGARLAHHHLQAGDAEEAVRHLLRNADQAVRAFATRDGFDTYALAAEVALGWAGAGDPAAQAALVRARVGQAETGLRIGELAEALQATDAAIQTAGERDDLASDRVRARCIRGQILDSQGLPDEALAALRLAVEDARHTGSGFGAMIFALSLVAMVLLRRGRHAEAEELARRALEETAGRETHGDRELLLGIGRLHTWLGHTAARRGEYALAELNYLRAQHAFDEAGDAAAAAMAELSLGNLAWRSKQLAEAEAVYRRVWHRCESLDDSLGAATAQTNLGNVLLDQGRPGEALQLLRDSEKAQRRVGRLEVLAETLRLQALALHDLGQTEGARLAARLAVLHAEKTGQAAAVAAARETLGKLGG